MKTASELSDAVFRAFEPPETGFVGIADNLLHLCLNASVEVTWGENACRVSLRRGAVEEVVGVPLRKSVFRAVLARIAVLCNERRADSVSPYGGRGEIALDSGPVVSVRFENTSAAQSLGLAQQVSNGVVHADERDGC
jgi:hypothetical protein